MSLWRCTSSDLTAAATFAVLAAFVAAGPLAAQTSSAPTAPRETSALTPHERIVHALDRLTFGPRPGDVDHVAAIGLDRWIDEQLDPAHIPDPETDQVLATLETQRKTPRELIADHPDPSEVQTRINELRTNGHDAVETPEDSLLLRHAQLTAAQLISEISAAAMLRAVGSERQLQEVMTEFWENHFSIYLPKSPSRYSMTSYDRDVIRPRALGKFRDLLGAVAKSPQMLFYLDNTQSVVDSLHPNVDEYPIEARRRTSSDPAARAFATLPRRRGGRGVNENYGRELMELHTLGVDGGFTQQDVQEVARAFTGWTIEAPGLGGGFVFRPELHDAGEKIVLGHRLPGGRGIEDGEDVLDILARAPATARFITTKLARHFISDDPPLDVVDRCAAVFTKTDGDIRQTLRCIIRSPAFFSRAAYRAKVKTPFEFVASALRALNVAPDTSSRFPGLVAQLGQHMYYYLTPEGWPDRGDAWMNSGAILDRINLGLRLAGDQVAGVKLASWAPYTRLNALAPAAQVNGVIDELLGGDVSPDTRSILVTDDNPVLGKVAGAPNMRPPPQLTGLAALVGLALGSPEFQRR